MMKRKRSTYHCSFCGKNQDQVRRLIAGPGGVYVCDECIGLFRVQDDQEVPSVAKNGKRSNGW